MAMLTNNASPGNVLKEIENNSDANRYNELFVALVDALRPAQLSAAEDKVKYVIGRLEQEMPLRTAIQKLFYGLLSQRDCYSLFTEAGILSSNGLTFQFFKHLKHRILPELPDKRSMEYSVQLAFNNRSDYKWVSQVPDTIWMQLFTLISTEYAAQDSKMDGYLCNALTVLSYRVSALGLENDIARRLQMDEKLSSPFVLQNNDTLQLLYSFKAQDKQAADEYAAKAQALLMECDQMLETIRKDSGRYGTSLEQTYLLVRAEQQIQRMRYLIVLLCCGDDKEQQLEISVAFFKNIVESENKRNSIRELFQKTMGLVAYQIAEHKGNTGEHYITSTRREYVSFLYAAMGGGAVISFIALFKTVLHHLPSAPFWEYFWYSLNYAFGFLLLQVTHTTLATKQPAMTASTLASYMDERKQKQPSLENVAHSFVLVWRSQTASFVGNLVIVFPLAYILAYVWELVSGHKFVTAAVAQGYLDNQNPLRSAAWLYACFTGGFLFLSGIISGYVDNKVRFSNIAARVREHPALRRIFTGEKRDKIARYVDNNMGGWAGNICLGFFLGFAPLIGKTFGFPFDIRHITISTAQVAFGLCGLDNNIPLSEILMLVIGVLGIGFFNFLVSFSLAFWVAIRSRGIRLQQSGTVVKLIFKYLRRHPLDFVIPPKNDRDVAAIYALENAGPKQ